MRFIGLFATLCVGCGGAPAVVEEPPSRADAVDWSETQVLILEIRDPVEYLLRPLPRPLRLRFTFVNRRRWSSRDAFVPLSRTREASWFSTLQLLILTSDLRGIVEHGYLAVEPTGLGQVTHPLAERCPRDLLRAALASPTTGRLHHLTVTRTGRDESHGCLYSLRP